MRNKTNLIDYVPDFDAPSFAVLLLLEVACRRRGLSMLRGNEPAVPVYMTSLEIHQWPRYEIQHFLQTAGASRDSAYHIADDIRKALLVSTSSICF
jgi:hypothetical protein